MSTRRQFPIQGEAIGIPWWLAEVAYEEYARRYGDQQTIERIAERGGFGRDEFLELLRSTPSHKGA